MSDKSLKDKAIDIKGKEYVLVSDRIIYFNDKYPNGSITTELVSEPLSDIVIVKASVKPDDSDRLFTGYSQAVKGAGFINKTAALENAETSAVGRALAMMGIGVIDSVASVDEINKAQGTDAGEAKTKLELAQAKAMLAAKFKRNNVLDPATFIEDVLGKHTIDNLEELEEVSGKLDEN